MLVGLIFEWVLKTMCLVKLIERQPSEAPDSERGSPSVLFDRTNREMSFWKRRLWREVLPKCCLKQSFETLV